MQIYSDIHSYIVDFQKMQLLFQRFLKLQLTIGSKLGGKLGIFSERLSNSNWKDKSVILIFSDRGDALTKSAKLTKKDLLLIWVQNF